jgi:septum formation protein
MTALNNTISGSGPAPAESLQMTQVLTQPIFLASASPRRHQLLTQMGIVHDILQVPAPPGEDEPLLPGEHPASYVKRTAREKAERAVAHLHSSGLSPRPILTADTTVMMGPLLLGKANTDNDVRDALAALSGQTHQVHTAIVLAWRERLYEDVSITSVIMKPLTAHEIDWYCARARASARPAPMVYRAWPPPLWNRSAAAIAASWDCRYLKPAGCWGVPIQRRTDCPAPH